MLSRDVSQHSGNAQLMVDLQLLVPHVPLGMRRGGVWGERVGVAWVVCVVYYGRIECRSLLWFTLQGGLFSSVVS